MRYTRDKGLVTSYSRLIKSSLVRLSSALVTASEFTGKSILPVKTKSNLIFNSVTKLKKCSVHVSNSEKVAKAALRRYWTFNNIQTGH